MKTLFTIIAFCLLTVSTSAMTRGLEKFTCPIDGEEFEDYVNYSGTTFGMRLDLKPIGPTPAPWALSTCPKCRFPLYKDAFSKEEIEKYKILVASKEFTSIPKEAPSYFLLARVKEHDNGPNSEIAYLYLQASWQVEDNKDKYKEYLKLSLTHYEHAFKKSDLKDESSLTSGILIAELSRQLGDFKKSIKQVKQLQKTKPGNEMLVGVLDQILNLSKESNSEPQAIE